MYFAQFRFAIANQSAYLTRGQTYVSLALSLISTLCFGLVVLSYFIRRGPRERTAILVLVPILAATAVVDLGLPGWYASATVSFVLFGLLAWTLRHEDIAVAMLFLAYACLQIPRNLGPDGALQFDFSLLAVSKFALVGAVYKSFGVLQSIQEKQTQEGDKAK